MEGAGFTVLSQHVITQGLFGILLEVLDRYKRKNNFTLGIMISYYLILLVNVHEISMRS